MLLSLTSEYPCRFWHNCILVESVERFVDVPSNDSKNFPLQIKKAIQSAESSVKEYLLGSKNQFHEDQVEKLDTNRTKKHP